MWQKGKGVTLLWGAAAVLAATWNLGILVALSSHREEPDRTTRANQEMDSGASELRKSMLGDQAARMERDLSAMRRNVEPQTATVTRTGDEASPAKQQADAATADLRKSLQQEHERASKLAQDLAAARRDVETQAALVAKTGAEASEFKMTADASTADLRKSLQQEHERASKLEQNLAAARRDVEAQTALAAKAGEEASQLKKAADGSADLRKSLQQEHERASKLEQDLAAARRDVETQTALAVKAGEEAAQLKQVAEKGSAEQRQSLQQEHDKAEALAKELSSAHAQIDAYGAQARKAREQTEEIKKEAAENSAVELRKSLQQERERAEQLEQSLASARRELETQTAVAAKARDEAGRLQQLADSSAAELKQSLRQASEQAEEKKAAADSGAVELRESLQQERERATRLEQDLAAARRDVETQTALAAKANDEASRLKQVADNGATDTTKLAAEDPIRVTKPGDEPRPHADDAAEAARLLARASVLLGQGDIGSARGLLERAAETGNAQANFALAETYDPLILAKWGVLGTHGDATKAREFYAKAEAGGMEEAKQRFDALRR
ncbi:hypothetical protein ACFFWD_27740 [Bradyrhizobium erythrophlei]|uniref:hypothetical protein n=1 Tax=Bradyrhizobium erythrophlei TaxID=1437360 RepID=UPI0035EF7032